jgi:hypothetical protein
MTIKHTKYVYKLSKMLDYKPNKHLERAGYETLNGIINRKIDSSPDWKHIKKLKSLV